MNKLSLSQFFPQKTWLSQIQQSICGIIQRPGSKSFFYPGHFTLTGCIQIAAIQPSVEYALIQIPAPSRRLNSMTFLAYESTVVVSLLSKMKCLFQVPCPLHKGQYQIRASSERATQMVKVLETTTHEEYLKHLDLFSLQKRKLRTCRIAIFKYLKACHTEKEYIALGSRTKTREYKSKEIEN